MRLVRGLEWREMAGLGFAVALGVANAFVATKEAFAARLRGWGRDA